MSSPTLSDDDDQEENARYEESFREECKKRWDKHATVVSEFIRALKRDLKSDQFARLVVNCYGSILRLWSCWNQNEQK